MKRMPTKAKIEAGAYAASALALTTVPQLSELAAHTPVAAATGGCLWWLHRRNKAGDFRKLLTAAQRSLPLLTGTAVYAANAAAPGTAWWEYAAPIVWGGLMGVWLPITRAGWKPTGDGTAPYPADFAGITARLWADATISSDTRLEGVEQHAPDRRDFTAHVVAPTGTAVPEMKLTDIAAVYDVPVTAVTLTEIPGIGPGRKRLTVDTTPAARTSTFEDRWAELVASPSGAIPGAKVARIVEQQGKLMILAEVPSGQVATIDHDKLCSAFGIDPSEMRLIAEPKGREALVTLYAEAPLKGARKATRELLTLDAHGRFTIGTSHDGRDAKVHMRSASGTLHGFLVGVTGSGKTVAMALMCAAYANAGVVSWVTSARPDAQMSAVGRYVDRQGSGALYTVRALRAAVALMDLRGAINAEVGHDFSPHSPYPALVLKLDEFNSLVTDPKHGEEIAELTDILSREGRKFGIGVVFAGQSLNLDKLGGSASLREQVQGGVGIVLRISGGISARQATGGLAGDVDLAAIPDRLNASTSLLDRIEGTEDDTPGASTQGTGHVVTGSGAVLMRTLYVHLPDDGTPDGLGDIFPAEGVSTLTGREADGLGELYGDWNAPDDDTDTDDGAGGVGGGDAFAPPGVPDFLSTGGGTATATKVKPATVKDKILAAVTGEMTAKEIRGAVDAAPGTVRNALSELVEKGELRLVDHGVYAPTDQ